MALRANFNMQSRLAHGGACIEFIAAAASDGNFVVCGMDVCSQFVFLTKVGRGGCTRTDSYKGAHYP